eukprot:1134984-Pyramimonas_sp.AAC.1
MATEGATPGSTGGPVSSRVPRHPGSLGRAATSGGSPATGAAGSTDGYTGRIQQAGTAWATHRTQSS